MMVGLCCIRSVGVLLNVLLVGKHVFVLLSGKSWMRFIFYTTMGDNSIWIDNKQSDSFRGVLPISFGRVTGCQSKLGSVYLSHESLLVSKMLCHARRHTTAENASLAVSWASRVGKPCCLGKTCVFFLFQGIYLHANHGAGIFTYKTGSLFGEIVGKYSIHGVYGILQPKLIYQKFKLVVKLLFGYQQANHGFKSRPEPWQNYLHPPGFFRYVTLGPDKLGRLVGSLPSADP